MPSASDDTLATTLPAVAAAQPTRRWSTGILRNVTSNWAGMIVNILVSFVLAPFVVRHLGSTAYGVWTLLMQFTGYLWLFDLGIRESVVKYVAQYRAADDREGLRATVRAAAGMYALVGVVALLASVGLAIAAPYFFHIPAEVVSTARTTAVITGATVAQGFIFNVAVAVLIGLQRFDQLASLGILSTIGRALLIVVFLRAGMGIVALSLVQLAMSLIPNLIIVRLCKAQLPYLSFRPALSDREAFRRLVGHGKYVLISNVGDKVIFATDSIVIGLFQPIAALTYYAIGGSLIDNFRSFIIAMTSILNPLSATMEASEEKGKLGLVFLAATKISILLGLPVCIGFIILGEQFINLWMGPDYGHRAGQVLAVLAAGHLIGLPYYTISGVLYGVGRHRIVAYSRLYEGAANLLLSLLLIKPLGILGVAIGTAVPHAVVVGALLPTILPSVSGLRLRDYYVTTYLRPVAAALPFAAACWIIRTTVMPGSILAFLAVVTAALPLFAVPAWFVALNGDERRRVTSLVGGRWRRA